MKDFATISARSFRAWAALAALLVIAAPTRAQKKDKNKNPPPPEATIDTKSIMRPTDSQMIDQAIGEELGYWQIGDAENMHKYFADDVVMVSGTWEPPVIGWDNFLKAYQAQRAQINGARLDRSNTLIKVSGNTAWATYQFIYSAQMEGKVAQFRGHTTLVLAKQGDRWVIALDHSSIVDSSLPQAVAPADPAPPGKP
jgi:uncharacterized protein (TIGR02246 family)